MIDCMPQDEHCDFYNKCITDEIWTYITIKTAETKNIFLQKNDKDVGMKKAKKQDNSILLCPFLCTFHKLAIMSLLYAYCVKCRNGYRIPIILPLSMFWFYASYILVIF